MRDMKAALGNGSKPDLTHVRTAFKVYTSRPCEYGGVKYVRGNYMRPTKDGTTKEAFERFREYLGSAERHISKMFDSMERHLAVDPNLEDEEGMRRAAYAADTDPGNENVGPSNLPHVAHLCAGTMMGIEQAIMSGLLPADPGQPWDVLSQVSDAVPAHVNPDQEVSPSQDTYACPHGVEVGRYCDSCQQYTREPGPNEGHELSVRSAGTR